MDISIWFLKNKYLFFRMKNNIIFYSILLKGNNTIIIFDSYYKI